MSETQYLVQGRNVFVKNTRDNPPTEKNLPVGIYDVQFNPDIGFYLQVRDEFELPKKLYGKTQFRTHRILDTFESRPYVTGVLLHGVKGSGKSMEAKNIAIEGVQRGLSTLVVSSAWAGPSFNKFLASIHDNIIVLFDEFEKVYDKEQQPALLTLLDGMIQTKMLCVFTANDTSKIDSHMINRPGRIF
jgi:SpoVK/Ycf46/Vps4 family AAA+-type ATPase